MKHPIYSRLNKAQGLLTPGLFAALLCAAQPLLAEDRASQILSFPKLTVPTRGESGEEVLRLYGSRLPDFARAYGHTEAEFRSLLKRDSRSLRCDHAGRLSYHCAGLVPSIDAAPPVTVSPPNDAGTTIAAEKTFYLHSRPTATRVIYLDFKGRTITGTPWNNSNRTTITVPPYSVDATVSTSFSTEELSNIRTIWQRVAEDYAPFDVDVTTEDPGPGALDCSGSSDLNYGVRVCIGGNSNWTGSTIGGIAGKGVFAYNKATYGASNAECPAFVFSDNLKVRYPDGSTKNGWPKAVADAVSHEVGHTLGLSHDGTKNTSGTTKDEYYLGENGWGPLMGGPYQQPLTQWSKGEYSSANNQEDDLSIIAKTLPYLPKDAGWDIYSAQVSQAASFSQIARIEKTGQMDFFGFTSNAGSLTLTAAPDAVCPDLNSKITLYNDAGTSLASIDPTNAFGGTLTYKASKQGTYFVSIQGAGSGTATNPGGYSAYGCLGNYKLSVSHPAASGVPPTGAITTSVSGSGLAVGFDGRNSHDPDAGGYITKYEWDFGDGSAHATGSTASRTYAKAGRYIASLILTDNTGLVSITRKTLDLSTPTALSVGSIGLSIQTPPGGKQASGVVSVRNNAGNPVSGATITASWSGLRSLSNLTATSDAQGFAAFKTSDPIATSGTFTLSVKDVAFPGARYDASKNAVSSASISVP